ncbi:MAG: adenylate kinase [Tannerella sp.]|jgi:adenylate kinase|nr:adenylate kinase [Tannerella sp.]
MLNIVIFGAPGSGKGTQSDLIKKRHNLAHISMGDVLREEIKNGTELGKTAKGFIEKGQLLPDNLVCDMLDKILDHLSGDTKGIIFDGFPRTIPQAEALEGILQKRGWDVTILLDLRVEDDELVKRLVERGKNSGRTDDNEETIKSRLEVYHTQTAPLAEYYRNKNKHAAINGQGTVEDIFNRIDKAIKMVSN